jgi:hypothetical protein
MSEYISRDDRLLARLRLAGWSTAVALIAAPLILMQVAPQSGFNWTASDFIFIAVLFGGLGLLLEIAVRLSTDWFYRMGAAVGLGTSVLLIWANLAVGYIGSEDNPYNLYFFGVVAIALAGALLAALRARGMALAMGAAGVGHAVAGGIGFAQDSRTGPITIIFVAMWLFSATLFRKAAQAGV